jgi:hypothetical protein
LSVETSLRIAKSAALAYTGAFIAGSVISIERGYVAEPLGVRTGRTVKRDVMAGWGGAGLAAPWGMIAQVWVALSMAKRPGRVGRRGRALLTFLAAMCLAGSVGEPVSHKLVARELPAPDAAVAVANIVLPIVMMGGALGSLTACEGERR